MLKAVVAWAPSVYEATREDLPALEALLDRAHPRLDATYPVETLKQIMRTRLGEGPSTVVLLAGSKPEGFAWLEVLPTSVLFIHHVFVEGDSANLWEAIQLVARVRRCKELLCHALKPSTVRLFQHYGFVPTATLMSRGV